MTAVLSPLSARTALPPMRTVSRPAEENPMTEPVPARPRPAQPDQAQPAPTWSEIVEHHSARIFRLAYRLTGNRADAEDLTQEVFVRVFRSLDSYRPGTLEGWLHRITTNLFLDQARRRARIRFDSLGEEPDAKLHPVPALDHQLLADAFDPDVEAALAEMAPAFRVAVVLCDVEGLSYEEIADVLGVKLGTVRSRIHRGRSQLRKALAHRAPSAGRSRYSGPVEPSGLTPSVR